MTLTVACVWVKGHVPFTAEYVMRLRTMARRMLPAHRFVCLTDRAAALSPDVETIPTQAPKNMYAWWSKVQLFNAALPLFGRVLYLDLDVLLVGDMTPIIEHEASFALAPDGAPAFRPRNGLSCVKRFNSSVMIWTHGEQSHLYDDWNPAIARRLWGDQDWIGERAPHATAMPLSWFPRISECGAPPWSDEAKVILCKKPKNEEAAIKWSWFREAWQ